MACNPKTSRLMRLAGSEVSLRLSEADRGFLKDLAKVQLISSDLADKNHYSHLKGSSVRSLDRLEKAGLITSKLLYQPGAAPIKTYQFADKSIAGAFGGKLPVTGAKRTDLHELMSARAYFELGRPSTFKLACEFSKAEIAMCGSLRPDAIYTDTATGETVVVEADIASGENPITIARLLAELKLSNKELAAALGKGKSWVSKRLGLLDAPIAVQRLIESGELSESEYYNNRKNVPSGIKNTGGVLKYQRSPTIEISLDAARSIVMILSDIAAATGATPIKLEPDTSKKRIIGILNDRAIELQKRLK